MIKLIVLDIDGCMTNGSITFDQNGVESKSFNVKDGLGITTWLKIGNEAAIITGRSSKIVERRAKELGIVHLFQGVKNKKEVLQNLLEVTGIDSSEVAVIGDDLNDLGMIELAAMSFAPSDAHSIIKERVDIVLTNKGGKGAVREMIDTVVLKNGQQNEFISVWQ